MAGGVRRGRGRGRRVRRGARKPWYMRKKTGNKLRKNITVTELVSAGGLLVNAGGRFACKFTDLPQASSYTQLFKQFCIRKLQAIIVPRFNAFDPNTLGGGGSLATSWVQPRMSYAINDTPALINPATELDVLTDNGAKIRCLNSKPIKINMRPKPTQLSLDMGGHQVATRVGNAVWFNTDNPQLQFSGTSIEHYGATFWITGNPSQTDYMFDLFYKITLSLRDPA